MKAKGPIPTRARSLAIASKWTGILHHHEHLHYDAVNIAGPSGSFVLEDHGDDTYVELCLTATDEQGLEDQECVDLKPQEVTYTFATVPAGLSITYGGSRYETPFKVKSYINARRIVEAPGTAGDDLTFDAWSDGGDAVHEITIEDGDRTLTATYTDGSGETIAADSDALDLENAPLVTPEPDMGAMGEMATETTGQSEPAAAEVESAATESGLADLVASSAASGESEAGPIPAGNVVAEVWYGIDGATIEELKQSTIYRNEPPETIPLDTLALPRGGENNYGARIRGYLAPAESGDYRFWISADDRGVLFLSTDDSPDNKIVVIGRHRRAEPVASACL